MALNKIYLRRQRIGKTDYIDVTGEIIIVDNNGICHYIIPSAGRMVPGDQLPPKEKNIIYLATDKIINACGLSDRDDVMSIGPDENDEPFIIPIEDFRKKFMR